MPIYPYKCSECGHSLEVIQKVTDPLLTECPNCRKPTLVKQVTAAGFQLKGGGWYVTDFRDSGKKEAGKPKTADAGGKETAADAGASKGETKAGETKTVETKTEPGTGASPTPAPPSVPTPPKAGSGESG